MTISLSIPLSHEGKPRITVVGVGGAGGNAVNNMITSHLEGVEFITCNTDAQALNGCLTDRKIQLGSALTHGLGAGARPEVGRAAAEESLDEILDQLQGSHMVFIAAGMGGGTGTGAAPVVAQAVREQGILTVAVVTKPFQFEGAHRMRLAEQGLKELQQHVDTLIVIPNQNLFRMANEQTTFSDAFRMADEVLHMGVRGVTDLIINSGDVNLDFADIRTVMSETGKAMMGTGEDEGEDRAAEAAEAAIKNPLLDDMSLKGATAVLINITGGEDMTLFEADTAVKRVLQEVHPEANVIFGSTTDSSMNGRIRVSVVATGIENAQGEPASEASQSVAEPKPEIAPARKFRFQPQASKTPSGGTTDKVRAPAATTVTASAVTQLRLAEQEDAAKLAEQTSQQHYAPEPAVASPYQPASETPAAGPQEEARPGLFGRLAGITGFSKQAAPAPQRRPVIVTDDKSDAMVMERPKASDDLELPAFLRNTK